tara:strand:+ start:400 stop:759 length:360 start_codon:yes stop_codon:yes gene_type:complete
MNEKSDLMTFDLKIDIKEFELKSGTIDLKKLLNTNNSIARSIEPICSFSHYVNFAETIINGFQINGSIKNVFNHKRFTQSLKYFQEKHHSTWSGQFTYNDRLDSFVFHAPDFVALKNNK